MMTTAGAGIGSHDRSTASTSLPQPPVAEDTSLPLRFRSHSKFAFLVLLVLGSVAYRSQFTLSSASASSSTSSWTTSSSPLLSKLFTTLALTSSAVGNGIGNSSAGADSKSDLRKADLAVFYNDTFTVHACEKHLHKRAGSAPSFLVAGVHKGGSTAIFGYLTRHGHIRPACCKEVNFFTIDRIWKKGLDYYLRHFPDLSNVPHVITGEGTPNYIRDPYAPARIQQTFPDVKIVVSFRDPVERFVSHFVGQIVNAKLRKQTPVKDCNAYIRKNLDAISRCLRASKSSRFNESSPFHYTPSSSALTSSTSTGSKLSRHSQNIRLTVGLPRGECLLENHTACLQHRCVSLRYEAAISRSIYVDQLERWLMFYPPERLHIVQAERLFQATSETMQNVARFLGLRDYNEKELKSFASTHRGSSHMADPISARCNKKVLREFFKPFNQRFYDLLEKNWPQVAAKWQPWPE